MELKMRRNIFMFESETENIEEYYPEK